MKQEEKDLLLKDLCARLPYGVRCSFGVDDAVYEVCGINPSCCGASEIQATPIKCGINGDVKLTSCKPYLFPMSSMTEEQKRIYNSICNMNGWDMSFCEAQELIDWINANHFDYRGLIEKSLALDATNLNIY